MYEQCQYVQRHYNCMINFIKHNKYTINYCNRNDVIKFLILICTYSKFFDFVVEHLFLWSKTIFCPGVRKVRVYKRLLSQRKVYFFRRTIKNL